VQGQRLTSVATCRVKGTGQKFKQRALCTVKKPKSDPTVVLKTKKKQKLKVRIVQKADGSATLLPFSRDKDYTYRKRS
jgi:hypothetical protein